METKTAGRPPRIDRPRTPSLTHCLDGRRMEEEASASSTVRPLCVCLGRRRAPRRSRLGFSVLLVALSSPPLPSIKRAAGVHHSPQPHGAVPRSRPQTHRRANSHGETRSPARDLHRARLCAHLGEAHKLRNKLPVHMVQHGILSRTPQLSVLPSARARERRPTRISPPSHIRPSRHVWTHALAP